MPLSIDPPTIFLALVASTMAAMLLLVWCYLLNRGERSVLWVAVGFFLASMSNILLGLRSQLPEWLSVNVGGGTLMLSIGILWVAARVFNGRKVIVWVPLAGPLLWLVACQVPAFAGDADFRVVAGSVACAAYYFLTAREILVRDGLVTRVAMAAVLGLHGIIVLARIPGILLDAQAGFAAFASTAWFGFATLEAMVFIQVIAFLMVSLTKERVEQRLRTAALTDALTGLANRRAFFQWGEGIIAQSSRHGRPFAAILFDLDRFKAINDRFGHPTGDSVIQAFASAASRRLRGGDLVGRLGGEEFAIGLPDTTAAEACLVAAEINRAFSQAVAAMAMPGLAGSASAGVAQITTATASVEDLLTAADRSLYEAKRLGGSQVCFSAAALPARAA